MGCQEGVHALDRSINDKDTDLCADLDWKRVFLWYAEPVTASIADVFDAYETLVKNPGGKVVRPFPPWFDQRQAKTTQPLSFLSWSNSSRATQKTHSTL